MTRLGSLNVGVAILTVALSAWLGLADRALSSASTIAAPTLHAGTQLIHEGGREGLRDASGHFVALQAFQRIASTSGVTDSLLLALAEPQRIAAFTRYSAEDSAFAYRYSGKPTLVDMANVEAIVALKPDLVLVNSLGGGDRIGKLRDAGLCVFDLGEMHGLQTLLPNIVTVATLLGRAELGRTFAARFERRMHTLALDTPEAARPWGVFLSIYGDSMYGGSTGTSYHDVIVAGGVRDAAEGKYRDWVRYTPETLLRLDPEVIVTNTGMTATLCRHPGLDRLRACSKRGRVVEVNGTLMDDPSLTMLDAAEALFEALHAQSPEQR